MSSGGLLANNNHLLRASLCPADVEWRYAKVGAPDADACKCPANPNCDGPTSCNVVPAAEEQWQVRAVSTSLCTSSDNSRAIGLGVGLGIGLPIALVMVFLAHKFMLRKEPEKEKVVPQQVQPPVVLPTPPVVQPAIIRSPTVAAAQPPTPAPSLPPSMAGQLTYLAAPPNPLEPSAPQPFTLYNDLDDIYNFMPMFDPLVDPYSGFQVASPFNPTYTI